MMKSLEKVLKIVDAINLKMCYVAMASLFVLMCLTTVNTVTRKTPFGGITDSVDITEILLTLIIFCGLAFLESEKEHIRVDMFAEMLPGVLKKIVKSGLYLLSAGILGFLFYATFDNIGSTYRSGASTQVLRIPQWPFVAVTAIALLLFALTVLLHALEIVWKEDK